MMRLFKSICSTLFAGAYVVGVLGVASSHVGRRSGSQRSDTPSTLEISGLDILKTYVCPTSSTDAKRQIEINGGTTTITIPLDDLEALFDELSDLLASIASILTDLGVTVSSTGTAPATIVPATIVAPAGSSSTLTDIPQVIVASSAVTSEAATSLVVPETTAPVVPVSSVTTPVPAETAAVSQVTSAPALAASTVSGTDICYEETTTIQTTRTVVRRAMANVVARGTAAENVAAASTAKVAVTGTSNAYVFNPLSPSNVAVHLGSQSAGLEVQCMDPSIDIVIVEVLISASSDGTKYPSISFNTGCDGQTSAMGSLAPGLVSCPSLASMIDKCQSAYGKKVMLRIGDPAGQTKRAPPQTVLAAPNNASEFVNTLWQLFGPPGSIDNGLRPFGDISVDGFDVDENSNLPASFEILATILRTNMASATDKQYYLSSTPRCSSAVLPPLLICDFVFVQFASDGACQLGSPGFDASFVQWSTGLEASNMITKPRLYVGARASHDFTTKQIQSLSGSNLGGVMVL